MTKRLVLTEEDIKDIKGLYTGEFNKKFYDFLKSNIEVSDQHLDGFENPFVLLYIGDRSRLLSNSKKYLVNSIVYEYQDKFPDLNESSLRLTAKYFIDQLKKKYFYEE
jgi:hypothetical protein